MKPSEAVAQRTMRQATSSSRRQRSSQQLVDDVIETVAGHNFNHFYARQYATAVGNITSYAGRRVVFTNNLRACERARFFSKSTNDKGLLIVLEED